MSSASRAALESVENAAIFSQGGELASSLIQDVYPDRRRSPIRALTPSEQFVQDVLLSVGSFIGGCADLELAAESVSGFKRRAPSQRRLTRLEHILYSLENHAVRAAVLTERALQLLNILFRLGLPASECKVGTVIRNDKLAGSAIASSYERLNKHIGPQREIRNIIIHRKQLADPTFDQVEAYFLLEKIGEPSVREYRSWMKTLTDRLLSRRQKELFGFNERAFSLARSFLDEALPVFTSTYKLL